MNKEGFKTVTGEQCDAKFRNLKRTYTKVEDNNNSTGRSPQFCEFYDELEVIFAGSDQIKPKSVCSSMHGTRKRKPNNEATGNLNCSEDLADHEDFMNDPKTDKAGRQTKQGPKRSRKSDSFNRSLQAYMDEKRKDNASIMKMLKESNDHKKEIMQPFLGVFEKLVNKL